MGDMFGHTFVNYFTDGEFAIKPPAGPENAIKHMVLEGYVDKRIDGSRLTANSFDASIAGVERFIYTNLVDARPGTMLGDRLLREGGGGTDYSIPRIFSTMRAELEDDIDVYDATIKRFDEEIKTCALLDPSCSKVNLTLEKFAYLAEIEYKKAWRSDIDRGLRRWPGVSHEVAKALFFNPARTVDIDRVEAILHGYSEDLASMSGVPDVVGSTASTFAKIVAVTTPDFLLEPIRQLRNDLLDQLLVQSFGMTREQLAGYLTAPNKHFDKVMTRGAGELITLERFNREYLHITDPAFEMPDEAFDYRRVPAAYNTVTMSKLILLAPTEVDRLIRDLGSDLRLAQPNIMLGFIDTLDGDSQWLRGMVLAQDCRLYRQMFMLQPGEQEMPDCTSGNDAATPVATVSPPPTATPSPTPLPSRAVRITGTMRLKDDEVGDDERETYTITLVATLKPGESRQFEFERCLGGEVRGEIAVTVTLLENQSARAQGTAKLFEGSSCSTNDLEKSSSFTLQAAPGRTSSDWRQRLENDEFASNDYADVTLRLGVD